MVARGGTNYTWPQHNNVVHIYVCVCVCVMCVCGTSTKPL